MSNARITGSVEVRPLRLGLVVAPGERSSFERAVGAASVCWGGRTFPIFRADEQQARVRGMAIALGIDALVACDDDPRSLGLAAMPGFSWMGYGHPIRFEEYGDRVVNLATVLSGWRADGRRGDVPGLVEWGEGDNLALFFGAVFGRVGDSTDYERDIRDVVAAAAPPIQICPTGTFPPPMPWLSGPLELGMWETHYHVRYPETGIAVIDPRSIEDLVSFWNLRAVGKTVLPWPEPFDARVAALAEAQMPLVAPNKWGPDGEPFTTVFTSADAVPASLSERLDAGGRDRVLRSFVDLEPHLVHGSGVGSKFVRHFEVGVTGGRRAGYSARVPLPQTGMTTDSHAGQSWQYLAARVIINSEEGLGDRTSFRAPAVRRLAGEVRRAAEVHSPVVRGVGEGVVIAFSASIEQELRIEALDSTVLIQALLKAAGFDVGVSDAGRWTARIVDILGGCASTLAAQPGVRGALDLASRENGATAEELKNAARSLAGPWGSAVGLGRGPSYDRRAMEVLAARRIIEARLSYTCPGCGIRQHAAPDRIGSMLTCEDCDHETPLSLQIVAGGKWRLKTRGLLTKDRLRSTFPIASSLLLLWQLERRGDAANLHYTLGLDLTRAGIPFEIDGSSRMSRVRG